MKVLQLATSPRPFFEQQVAALEKQGVDCTVLTAPGEHEGDSSRSPTAYAKFYSKILAEVRSTEYDLVHANYGLVAPLAVAQPVRPVVVTLWGTDLMGDHSWLRSLSRFGARRADAAIVPSRAMSRELEVGVDHELLPFAVDTDLFRPIPQETARKCVGWESDRPIALFPYDRTRAVKDFPRAKRIVERADVDVDLRPVSGVAHEEMPYYMNASDVLLVTSRRESGPMVVKEAAACNLPIVSTDVGFVRETVDGVTDCVVGDDDAALVGGLERVLADGERTDARESIDGLGLDSFGDRLVDVYRRALGRTGVETDRPETAVGGDA